MGRPGRKVRFENITLAQVPAPRFAQEGRIMTVREVENLLRCDRSSVYRLIREKRISAVRVVNKWLISSRSVESLVDFGADTRKS